MGVRYVAAVTVLAYHLGWIRFTAAVPFFFVLSGFVLTYKYVRDDVGLTVDVRTFWIARIARLYPAYALALVILAVQRWACGYDFMRGLGGLAGAGLMVSAWNPRHVFAWNTPGWTVTAEMFFYLCFPLLVGPLLRLRTRRALFTAMALSWVAGMAMTWACALGTVDAVHATDWWFSFTKFAPIVHLPDFLVGMLLGRWYAGWGGHENPRLGALLSTSCAAIAIGVSLGHGHASYLYVHNTLLVPVFAVMVWGLTLGGGLAVPLSTRWMVLLGHASYAVYILQEPVVGECHRVLGKAACAGNPVFLVAYVAGLSVLGIGVFRLLEEPMGRALRSGLRPLVPSRPLSLGTARWEAVGALIVVALLVGETSLLPQRYAELPPTRLERALASVGVTPVAWVEGADARYLVAYSERLPGLAFVPWRAGRDVALVLAPPRWRDGVHTRRLDAEADGAVALWCHPDTPLPPRYRFTGSTVFGNRRLASVQESGFHETESDASGRTWRWTQGHATLEIPPPAGLTPGHLLVEVSVARPTRLEIRVDGVTAWQGTCPVENDRILVPLRKVPGGSTLQVDLLSSTFVPHRLDPTSGDTRRLGVSIRGMRLQP